MDRTEFARSTRDYITDYIKFADAKAGAVLALGLAVLAGITNLADRFLALTAKIPTPWLWAGLLAAGVAAIASTFLVLHVIHALMPRAGEAEKSLASFPDIAKLTAESYSAACESLAAGSVAKEIEKHSVQLASIASTKFAAIGDSVWWLRIQVLSTFTLSLIYVIGRSIAEP